MQSVLIKLPAASGPLTNLGGCLIIHSTRETNGGAAAVYRLWDGVNNAGTLLLTVSLAAKESTRDYFPVHCVPFNSGLYFELVSGALEGTVSVLDGHRCSDAWHAMIEQQLIAYSSGH